MKLVRWSVKAQSFPRPLIELQSDDVELCLGVLREIRTFGEVLPQQSVGILVGAALPGTLRIAEVHLDVGRHREAFVLRHLKAPIPGEGATQLAGQLLHVPGERARHDVAVFGRQLHQHHEARAPLHQGRDLRAWGSAQQVPFPMTRNRSIFGLCRSLAEGLSGFLCVRHIMTTNRSQYAEQTQAVRRGGECR